ncbi:MAG: hypothetical protein AB9919_12625 [Geobacteraceae bacterium]|jgi:hypothetical protein
MARRKLAKTLVFSLLWAIFLSLLITNWDALKSMQWRDNWASIKISGIGELLHRSDGYIFIFSLIILFLLVCLRHNRKAQIGRTQPNGEDWQELDEFMQAVERDCDPSYSPLGGNIHHKTTFDKDWEWKK